MRSWMIAFSLGILVVAWFPMLPPPWSLVLVVLINATSLCYSLHKQFFLPTQIAITGLCFVLGITWHCYWANTILQQHLPMALQGQDLAITGSVVSIPQRRDRYQQFKFYIDGGETDFTERLVLLNYYGERSISPGQRWQFVVRLNKPHGFANPGGFDYEAWLFQQGLAAKGYIRENASNGLLADAVSSPQNLRFLLLKKLSRLTADLQYGGVIQALIMGERGQISNAQWQLFTDTGTNHLMVISGLHVGFVAGLIYVSTGTVARLLPWVLLVMPAQKIAAVGAIIAAFAYSFLAGFSLPTQRAVVMISVYMMCIVTARNVSAFSAMGLALVIVLALNPLSVVSAGLWLSFVAVAGLLMSVRTAQNTVWHRFIKPQLVVFLALLVPLSFWLQQISFLAPLANLLAIPLISLFVVPLCFVAVLLSMLHEPLALLVFNGIDCLLIVLMGILQWLLDRQSGLLTWNFAVYFWVAYLCAMLACGLLLLPVKNLRWLALPLLAPLFLPGVPKLPAAQVNLSVLDVGQGLAVVIQTANHVLVYDTGPKFSDDFSAGDAVLYPALQTLGIDHINMLLVSHGDNDHAGGVEGLLSSIGVGEVLSSASLNAVKRTVGACQSGQSWTWDEVKFSILHPAPELVANGNDSSCVLLVELADQAILLPGDIEEKAERRLLRDHGERLASTVLVAPHHGSNTSSSLSFITRVQPELVIFSSGYQNRFGHPSATVQRRYQRIGAQSYNTADYGMISLSLRRGQPLPTPIGYRCDNRRYWRSSCEIMG